MLEEGVSLSGDPTLPLICRIHVPPPELSQRSRPPQTLFNLQATRGRHRNQSRYSDSTNPNWIPQDPSDEDTGSGVRAGGPSNPEQLSDNLSSFSLTSLHPPDSLPPPLAKKCSSTGSLAQGSLAVRNKDGRCLYGFDPWTEATGEETERDASPVGAKTCSQTVGSGCRKNRWNARFGPGMGQCLVSSVNSSPCLFRMTQTCFLLCYWPAEAHSQSNTVSFLLQGITLDASEEMQ